MLPSVRWPGSLVTPLMAFLLSPKAIARQLARFSIPNNLTFNTCQKGKNAVNLFHILAQKPRSRVNQIDNNYAKFIFTCTHYSDDPSGRGAMLPVPRTGVFRQWCAPHHPRRFAAGNHAHGDRSVIAPHPSTHHSPHACNRLRPYPRTPTRSNTCYGGYA